jgi:hypothetical protein
LNGYDALGWKTTVLPDGSHEIVVAFSSPQVKRDFVVDVTSKNDLYIHDNNIPHQIVIGDGRGLQYSEEAEKYIDIGASRYLYLPDQPAASDSQKHHQFMKYEYA